MNRALPILALALLVAPDAAAGGKKKLPQVAGDYPVTFDEVSNSCKDTGLSLGQGTITLKQTGKKLTVSFPLTPILKGWIDVEGKLQARAPRGRTGIRGIDGEYSFAGAVTGAELEALFVAVYYAGSTQYCQQSWTVKGAREGSGKKK